MKRTPLRRKTPLRPSSRQPDQDTRGAGKMKRRKPMKARNAKRGGHRFPKAVCQAFREWIRGLSCCVPTTQCSMSVVVAHVKSRGAGGADIGNCVPLCAEHHHRQHQAGIRSFQAWYSVDLAAIATELGARWIAEHPEEAA